MRKKRKNNLVIAGAIILTLFGTACNKSGTTNAYPQTTTAAVTGLQLANNARFGSILTDNNGSSLYFFANGCQWNFWLHRRL